MPASDTQIRDKLERLLNLALYLSQHPDTPISAESIRAEIYPNSPSESAFKRMLGRDKELLAAAGLTITVTNEGDYTFESAKNYYNDLNLSFAERAAIRLAATAVADDPLFPFPVALHMALAKLSRQLDREGEAFGAFEQTAHSNLGTFATPVFTLDATEQTTSLQEYAELLLHAQRQHKQLRMSYRNASGTASERVVAPYGLYLLNGQWYLVAFDDATDTRRVFALARIHELTLLDESFEPPTDFDIARWVELPFRLSGEAKRDAKARLRIPSGAPERPETITFSKGSLEPQEDGSWVWEIAYPSGKLNELVTYALEHNLTFEPEEQVARDLERQMLEAVIAAHV